MIKPTYARGMGCVSRTAQALAIRWQACKVVVVNLERCGECYYCESMCPTGAIHVYKEEHVKEHEVEGGRFPLPHARVIKHLAAVYHCWFQGGAC